MSSNRVFVRADGGAEIGLGHLVRCIALAQMLKDNFEITFVCKEIPDDIVDQLADLNFALQKICAEEDFTDILTGAEIVVLDHYFLDTSYQQKIKSKGCKLVCIDDLHNQVFFADLIINHAPGVKAEDYRAQLYTQFALGLDYALLRPEFLNVPPVSEEKDIETAFVCFGGSDFKNITQVAMDVLRADNRFKEINVVVGAAFSNAESLADLVISDKRFKIYKAVSPGQIKDLMAMSQLAIVPASGILQETISQQVKAIVSGMYVENQKFIFENYLKIGAFESAADFNSKDIKIAVDKCFKDENKLETRRLIDCKSKTRLVPLFKQISA